MLSIFVYCHSPSKLNWHTFLFIQLNARITIYHAKPLCHAKSPPGILDCQHPIKCDMALGSWKWFPLGLSQLVDIRFYLNFAELTWSIFWSSLIFSNCLLILAVWHWPCQEVCHHFWGLIGWFWGCGHSLIREKTKRVATVPVSAE